MSEISIFFDDPLNPQVGAVARLLVRGQVVKQITVDWAGSENATLETAARSLIVQIAEGF